MQGGASGSWTTTSTSHTRAGALAGLLRPSRRCSRPAECTQEPADTQLAFIARSLSLPKDANLDSGHGKGGGGRTWLESRPACTARRTRTPSRNSDPRARSPPGPRRTMHALDRDNHRQRRPCLRRRRASCLRCPLQCRPRLDTRRNACLLRRLLPPSRTLPSPTTPFLPPSNGYEASRRPFFRGIRFAILSTTSRLTRRVDRLS